MFLKVPISVFHISSFPMSPKLISVKSLFCLEVCFWERGLLEDLKKLTIIWRNLGHFGSNPRFGNVLNSILHRTG